MPHARKGSPYHLILALQLQPYYLAGGRTLSMQIPVGSRWEPAGGAGTIRVKVPYAPDRKLPAQAVALTKKEQKNLRKVLRTKKNSQLVSAPTMSDGSERAGPGLSLS